MKIWHETTIIPEENTISDDAYNDDKSIKAVNSEPNPDTKFQELKKDFTWESVQDNSSETPIVRVFDVAAYILEKMGSMSTMKLQKLVYYSQAWSLVWDEKPLFDENIEAWANGPVVRDLFYYHRGRYELETVEIGNPRLLDQEQQDTVDAVLDYYGNRTAQWLIDLTHLEDPWLQAREGLPPLERGNKVIPLDSMADYYSSLPVEEDW